MDDTSSVIKKTTEGSRISNSRLKEFEPLYSSFCKNPPNNYSRRAIKTVLILMLELERVNIGDFKEKIGELVRQLESINNQEDIRWLDEFVYPFLL